MPLAYLGQNINFRLPFLEDSKFCIVSYYWNIGLILEYVPCKKHIVIAVIIVIIISIIQSVLIIGPKSTITTYKLQQLNMCYWYRFAKFYAVNIAVVKSWAEFYH